MIVVLDFGSQYTHLISRRIRQLGVYSEVVRFSETADKIKKLSPQGIILSGGPKSIYERNAPKPDNNIFSSEIPIIGICYGAQLIAHLFGGDVRKARAGEYGRTRLTVKNRDKIFSNLPENFNVWMSHGDRIEKLPQNFTIDATSDESPISAFHYKNIFAVQFHPEVTHTEFGMKILENFVFNICSAKKDWSLTNFVEKTKEELLREIKNGGVLCAVSGGVDSTVLATLLTRTLKKVVPVFIDSGLLRKGEVEEVSKNFQQLNIPLYIENAEEHFLRALEGVRSPEKKRRIIGKTFVKVFERFAKRERRKGENLKFLAQGTLYPDVIESGKSLGPAHTIKTHHNVGGLPEKLNFRIVEPLKLLYKDEVREVGKILEIPEKILNRYPFPGPGLAVRIIGEVTKEKIEILKEADYILQKAIEEEKEKERIEVPIWQVFAVLLNSKSTGVAGDKRRYGYVVAIRCVSSTDAMTADWSRLPYELLDKIARKITATGNVSRVVYDITSKPPATIEWE